MNILLSGFSCLVTGKEGFALNGANCEVKLLESRRRTHGISAKIKACPRDNGGSATLRRAILPQDARL